MAETRVKIQSIVDNQLPDFIREDSPLLADFLKQYYISQEYPGGSYDIIQNIDEYLKLEELYKSVESTVLTSDISFTDTSISVSGVTNTLPTWTRGFPDRYGLIKIDDEIITYTHKTLTSFEGCVRGFSGVTSYSKPNSPEELVFSSSKAAKHTAQTRVFNLSVLFLNELLKKLKKQFIPGFDERSLDSDLNQRLFIKQSKDFYASKGTDKSFKILFGALYGENVEVVKPRDFLFRPSDAGYRRTKDLVVQAIEGDPLTLLNNTLYQDANDTYGIDEAYAPITGVEKISINNEDYYKLSFDSDYNKDLVLDGSLYGNFSVHPFTKSVSKVSTGSTIIDVDSTVGFPTTGTLVLKNANISIAYTGKSITQFYNISGLSKDLGLSEEVRLDVNAYGYSGITTENPIKVRIGSVLDEIVIPEETFGFQTGDTAKIQSLGISSATIRRLNWIDNISNTFKIESFNIQDSSNFTYEIQTFDKNNLKIGDEVQVNETGKIGEVVDIVSANRFYLTGQGELPSTDLSITRIIKKVDSVIHPYLNQQSANVQNTYTNFSDESLVASSSLPFYKEQKLNTYDKKVTISGSFSGTNLKITSTTDHGFYTGDKVYYKPSTVVSTEIIEGFTVNTDTDSKFPELDEGLYYVNRVDSTSINLASSPSNLAESKYISVSGIVTNNTIQYFDFNDKLLESQNILREIKDPVRKSGDYTTNPGKTGILINGVEILNYKSSETVFFGKLNDVVVTAPGSNYDIINPPLLKITDSQGIGATGTVSVSGSLEKIQIVDSGFDYLNTPTIDITGGNGRDAFAYPSLSDVEHSVNFNSDSSSVVSTSNYTIGFSTFHKFRDNEKVVYKTDKQKAITGLSTDAFYYASVIDGLTIKLYKTESDSISGINTVALTGLGSGVHSIKSSEKKRIITDIVISNTGSGYQNKSRTCTISGINTAINTINIDSHGYETGEEIVYSNTDGIIGGLTTTSNYVVSKINEDSFKLAPVGLGSTSKTQYLDTEQFIEFTSTGSGVHSFNYPPITVTLTGNIGVSTLANQDFTAKLNPIFRGSIDSVHLTSNGSQYGNERIINYNRQPTFELLSGSGAELVAIVNNGRIVEVLVSRGGSGYNSTPELIIKGVGDYAKLVPVVENGVITSVSVVSGGIGYTSDTLIEVEASGKDCKLFGSIQNWTVNLFAKYFNTLEGDDGVIFESDRKEYGLQYGHIYAPRKLRETSFAKSQGGGNPLEEDLTLYGVSDLRIVNNEEASSSYHSPIIGWAYDGNPIYGPYGYTTPEGGTAKLMKTGYELVTDSNRPSVSNFPTGFFNEDYQFKGNGDLDEHNGRFGITPDYPNGVYAYFATLSDGTVDTDGPFEGFKRPEYPYFIGTSFYSEPNPFNFRKSSNQDEYDLNNFQWFRNTTNYKLLGSNSSYDYVFNSNKLKVQNVDIKFAKKGSVTNIGILTGGNNYSVNDRLLFDNSGTSGRNASSKVSHVFGKDVVNVGVTSSVTLNVEFQVVDNRGNVTAFTTSPHGLKNLEILSVSGLSTEFSKIEGSYNIGVRTDSFVTTLGIGTTGVTGLTTYFYVSGLLGFPYIRENDILGIGTQEKVKVLNVDANSQRIRVVREHDSTVGSAYSSASVLTENPRKFNIVTGFKTEFSLPLNKELYFEPSEAVGVGTVGLGKTVTFSLPGVGATQVFVPIQQIYLPNHQLQVGERVSYSSHGGTQISVYNGFRSFSLPQDQDLFVAPISENFVGLSTVKVGLGTTGKYVGIGSTNTTGLLFFENIGTGDYHSLKTNKTSLTGEISKNIVTVSTASTHGLKLGESVIFNTIPTNDQIITVKYNDYNRRIVFNPKTFAGSNIDTSLDTIQIFDHGLKTGDKVIHTSTSPAGGLVDQKIYYVLYFTKDKFRLCETSYDLSLDPARYVNITSTASGTISPINPNLKAYKNKIIKFDVSDSSLSFLNNTQSYSAFELNFYKDSECNFKFDSTESSRKFEVIRSGTTGVNTSTVSLVLNEFVPNTLYYKFDLVNEDFVGDVKKQLVIDDEVRNNNQINLVDSGFSGEHTLVGVGTTTFVFNIPTYPEQSSYTQSDSNTFYETKSLNAYGPISRVQIQSSGDGYEIAPGIGTVVSKFGSGAIFDVDSNTIGNVVSTKLEDIGFDYPSDFTLSPALNLPEILKVNPLSSFRNIGITSAGKNYITPPELVVLDGFTNEVVDDVILKYEVGSTKVRILKNTFGLYDVTPTIIPIGNPNGVGINTISYNSTTKDVTVGFNTGFSDAFPFSVGDKVLIENTSVGIASTARGYNSSAYGYTLFTLTSVNPALGGNTGEVTYNLRDYLTTNEFPGVFNDVSSYGRMINQNEFPIFEIGLQKNNFLLGEDVKFTNGSGVVENWNNKTEVVKISTDKEVTLNDTITGQTSNTKGVVIRRTNFDSYVKFGSTSFVEKGWSYDTGFLNNNVQRIPDNDYYQYFSYALRSKIDFSDWDDAVSSINHTSGFKKFSDLIIESRDEEAGKVFAGDSVAEVVADLIGEGDLNCNYFFDLASETTTKIGTALVSRQINFENRVLTDYFESVGNRVLIIDDISNDFNSDPRPTRFETVNSFELETARTKKYFTFVRDKRFTKERQLLIVSLLHNDVDAYLNQYGRVETHPDLGSFDFSISGTTGLLNFFPVKFSVNDYDVSTVSHDLKSTVAGIGSTDLGSVVNINSQQTSIASGTSSATTIVGIASTYRAAKILVEIGTVDNSYFEFDELNLLFDGSEVDIVEYGQLTTNTITDGSSGPGLGTYFSHIDGSRLKIDFTPNAALGVGVTVNTLVVSIASSTSSATGIGTQELSTGLLNSGYVSIAASSSPGLTTITEYPNNHSAAYYLVSVEDTTNQRYQLSEVIVADDGDTPVISEFGILESHSSLGIISTGISTTSTVLSFIPNAGIDVQVRTFQNALSLVKESLIDNTTIDFNNAAINSGNGTYEGTERSLKRSFNLLHGGREIFRRTFDGSDSTGINTSENSVFIPDHFFVSGEEVTYNYTGAGTTSAIGIASTSVVGVGTTDKLPSTLYVVKVNESKVKFAANPTDALLSTPKVFDFVSVGIGTSHSITAKNQNSKALISIDNYIQSPIVSTALTSSLSLDVELTDNRVTMTGVTSFFGGNLIQINDEIMKINTVGFGSTNVVLVDRTWMGTGLSTHAAGDLITLVDGNYNIIDNTVHFVEAPQGLTPIGSTTNPPDQRDYVGIATHSTFHGRTFMRSGVVGTSSEAYDDNYVFDDLSSQFTGVGKTFTLSSSKQSVAGFSTNNAIILINGVFQGPQGTQAETEDYDLTESAGITSITFSGMGATVGYDVNTSSVPVGGVIVSVGSTEGFGLQPLISAGGTAVVSAAGTIQSISIGNSGSGYRIGIQTVVNVGVQTSSTGVPNIEFIGTASVSNGRVIGIAITNPGTGYTSTNPPSVVFDDPISYSNLPLIYSSSSSQGIGTGGKIDIVVGQGSSVIDFTISNTGYGYRPGEILTFATGGNAGIPTDTTKVFKEYQLTIDKTFNDKFSGWSLGQLQVLDTPESLFNGVDKTFELKLNRQFISIRSAKGSNIDVQSVLLIFINDILQVPGQSYVFNGGSIVEFTEAPKSGDTAKVLFYKGSGDVDVVFRDVLETVKVGDNLTLNYDKGLTDAYLQQDERVVTGINTTDSVKTNPYGGPGITDDETIVRPLKWCRQTEDKIIDGKVVGKDRVKYEVAVQPTTLLTQSVGVGSTVAFVQSVRPFFDPENENPLDVNKQTIELISQNSKVSAAATANVSAAGTITSITITDGGFGYTSAPIVTIANPVGLGTTTRATATSAISSGVVNAMTITGPGTGYTSTNPPVVLIEPPKLVREKVTGAVYEGDFGIITGISTTSVGVASTGLVLDLFIPPDSFLRNDDVMAGIVTVSGIQTGYYFTVFGSNVGNGVTSLSSGSSIIGIGSTFIDNVYQVAAVSIANTDVIGQGTTTVAKVTVSLASNDSITGLGYSAFFGQYSWGRVTLAGRTDPNAFSAYTNDGITGLSTSAILRRVNPLKFVDYTS